MFFTRMPPSISGGAVALYGKRFDVTRVLYAYGELIDHLSAKLGMSRSYCTAEGWERIPKPVTWPEPAKHDVCEAWRLHALDQEVLGSSVHHRIGPIEAYAFMLGQDWAQYDIEANELYLRQGDVVLDYADPNVDASPIVDIHGQTRQGEVRGMSEAMSEKVRAIVLADLAKFGFTYSTSSFARGRGDTEIVARIGFPHSIYGKGHDWLRVRCVSIDGNELHGHAN